MSPMLGTSLDDLPENSVEEWEKPYINCLNFELIASDYAKQHSERDPLLYPVEVSLEEAKLLPRTVLFTSEFDWMRRDTFTLVTKLKKAGTYVDHGDYAGSAHCFYAWTPEPNTDLFHKDMKKVFDNYVPSPKIN